MQTIPKYAQWEAARALAEGALPTCRLIARVLGVGAPAVAHHASREGWALLDLRRGGVRLAHAELARLAGRAAELPAAGRGARGGKRRAG